MELQITQTRHPKSVAGGRMNGWSGPSTRPAFCQIKIVSWVTANKLFFKAGLIYRSMGDLIYQIVSAFFSHLSFITIFLRCIFKN